MNSLEFIKQRIVLLTENLWSAQDIKNYFQVSISHAHNLKMKVLARSPKLEINRGKKQTVVLAEEVLKFHGTSRNQELEKLNQAYQFFKDKV